MAVTATPAPLRFGPDSRFELQALERRLLVDGAPAALGARAFDLLLELASRPGELRSKHELIEAVWPGVIVEEGNLATQISTLRKVLGGEVIATIPGRGYRFAAHIDRGPIEPGTALPPTSDLPASAPSPVSPDRPLTHLPATLPPLVGRSDDLAALRGAANADDAGTARMRLELKAGPTSCGPADAFLGCGRPDNSIELTFDATRYEFANVVGTKDAIVGPGRDAPLSGMTVLMHEVGHWFGLPHLNFKVDEVPDMMQDTYIEGACVSGLNAMLMSNMTDEAHAQRFRVGGGFRRQRK